MKLRDLTPDDWDGIAQYVTYVRDGLGLHQWTIHISQHPCEKNAQASIAPVYGRRHATLFLSRRWPTTDRTEQKHTIIHEMLHLLFFDVQSVVHRVGEVISEELFYTLWDGHTEALEFAVDHLADVLLNRFDDPPVIYQDDRLAS